MINWVLVINVSNTNFTWSYILYRFLSDYSFVGTAGFSSLTEVFCKTRDTSSAANVYVSYISHQLSQYAMSNNSEHIAALIIEPGYYKYSLFWVPLFQYMMSLMLNLISLCCLFWYFSTCYVWTIQNLMLIFSGKCVPTDNFACAIAFTFTILNRTKYLCVRVGCTSIV